MQYWPFVTSVNMNLSRSTSANRIFSNVPTPTLTSLDERTQLTNERFDPTYPSAHCSSLAPLSSFISMCITVHYVF
ncbi:hypothetical protein T11_11932, partial [Trichinella zimbabwensis]